MQGLSQVVTHLARLVRNVTLSFSCTKCFCKFPGMCPRKLTFHHKHEVKLLQHTHFVIVILCKFEILAQIYFWELFLFFNAQKHILFLFSCRSLVIIWLINKNLLSGGLFDLRNPNNKVRAIIYAALKRWPRHKLKLICAPLIFIFSVFKTAALL